MHFHDLLASNKGAGDLRTRSVDRLNLWAWVLAHCWWDCLLYRNADKTQVLAVYSKSCNSRHLYSHSISGRPITPPPDPRLHIVASQHAYPGSFFT